MFLSGKNVFSLLILYIHVCVCLHILPTPYLAGNLIIL